MGRPRTRWQPGDEPHTFTCDGRRFTVLLPGPDSPARTRPRPLRLRLWTTRSDGATPAGSPSDPSPNTTASRAFRPRHSEGSST